jgi:hypothetical protein
VRLCAGRRHDLVVNFAAFYQGVANPVPRVPHPDWLLRERQVRAVSITVRTCDRVVC